jgi:hypothetical protein
LDYCVAIVGDGFSISLSAALSTLFPANDSFRLSYRYQRRKNFIIEFKRARVRQPILQPNLRFSISVLS